MAWNGGRQASDGMYNCNFNVDQRVEIIQHTDTSDEQHTRLTHAVNTLDICSAYSYSDRYSCSNARIILIRPSDVKLEFHRTRTSSPTSARGFSRGNRRVRRIPHSACHEPDTHDDPRRLVRRLVRHARFSSRGCPLGMRACTRVNVYYTR